MSNGQIVFDGWGGYCFLPQCFGSSNPHYDLWAVEPDGSGLVNLTAAPGVDTGAAWSPAGDEIAFASNRNGDHDIFVMNPDGSELQSIVTGRGDQREPTWSPSGRRIAYVDDVRRTKDIMVMRRDGSRSRRIASFYAEQVFALDWSPNGKWITFTKGDPDIPYWRIFVVHVDGTGLRGIGPNRFWGEFSSWSPDSRQLAFDGGPYRGDTVGGDIWVVDLWGSEKRRLVATDGNIVYDPEWSPDGKSIVYSNNVSDPTGTDLWIINLDGSGDRQLLAKPDSFDYEAVWQPIPEETQ